MSDRFTIALIGNPNSGKTTLFNYLTGSRQKVGNWPGVTVERKYGQLKHGQSTYDVVDLPGTYALHVGNQHESLDEQIAQNYVLSSEADLLLNIIDASSLERGLYLTSQLLDAGIPMVVALNMMDVADSRGLHLDPHALTEAFGFPFMPIVASRGEGVGALLDVVTNMANKPRCHEERLRFPAPIEAAIERLSSLVETPDPAMKPMNQRLLATALLERDGKAMSVLGDEQRQCAEQWVEQCEKAFTEPLADLITSARYDWIQTTVKDCITQDVQQRKTVSDYLDDVFLNRFLAVPLFFSVMYLMFMFTINFGSVFIDFFDLAVGAFLVELPKQWLMSAGVPDWLTVLLTDGVGGGIQLVATFIPIIGCLFLFLSFLEDSGYMARAAFIVDRFMRGMGLPGKSFVPLIVGFGCNVPSVMAARTLENQNDRLLTTIMAPFMSCGARLTVYALFAAAFFPNNGQNVVFGLYIIGIILAVLSALVIRRFVMTGAQSAFIIELPAYHLPTIKGLLILTWQRLRGFMMRAGKAIVAVVIVLNFVNSIGVDGSFGNQDTESSVLSAIGKSLTPVFVPMGVKEDNWPATVGIFTGAFAKEVVVGTLDTLYGQIAVEQGAKEITAFNLQVQLQAAWQTIPDNMLALVDNLTDPLGINIGDVSDAMSAAEQQEVQVNTLLVMQQLFDGPLAAFAYLLFILLYFPCVATLGAIYKEQGRFWMLFTCAWSLVMGYSCAVLCYQVGQLASSPESALGWIVSMLALMVAAYTLLLKQGKQRVQRADLIPVVNI